VALATGCTVVAQSLLKELDVTLVVFVDDLDRCLPPTVIGTLEAMRLFLFMEAGS
jgi:predicted KAP-like P-loop ATPase